MRDRNVIRKVWQGSENRKEAALVQRLGATGESRRTRKTRRSHEGRKTGHEGVPKTTELGPILHLLSENVGRIALPGDVDDVDEILVDVLSN